MTTKQPAITTSLPVGRPTCHAPRFTPLTVGASEPSRIELVKEARRTTVVRRLSPGTTGRLTATALRLQPTTVGGRARRRLRRRYGRRQNAGTSPSEAAMFTSRSTRILSLVAVAFTVVTAFVAPQTSYATTAPPG